MFLFGNEIKENSGPARPMTSITKNAQFPVISGHIGTDPLASHRTASESARAVSTTRPLMEVELDTPGYRTASEAPG